MKASRMSNAARVLTSRAMFVVFCAFFVLVAGGYILRSGAEPVRTGDIVEMPRIETITAVGAGGGVLFASSSFDPTNGHVGFLARGAHGTPPVSRLRCERVHFSNGAGLCLSADRGFLTTYSAHVFGPDFKVRATVPLQGPPSRARVSPDGRYAASTVFVTGDSYAAASFSTRTTLFDVHAGRAIADLEEFTVIRSGAPFKAVDFNFWGVTFARDSNRFFATLRTGGTIYLVEGNIRNRTATVIREGVECPSLSPDNTRIAFKRRAGGSYWRLHVLDLKTLRDTPLSETRNFDDQAEWLDNDTVAYALRSTDAKGGSDIWTLNVHSGAPPTLLIPRAYSPAAVR